MNEFYAKLNVPTIDKLIKETELVDREVGYKDSYRVRPIDDVLTEYAIEFFKDHNLNPRFIIDLFPYDKSMGPVNNRTIHTDAIITNGVWTPIICGINFELFEEVDAEWSWWDMDKFPPVYINSDKDDGTDDTMIKLRGSHHGMQGVPDGAVELARLRYGSSPYLIRSEIPHLLTYNSKARLRHGMSIRFHETWKTWDECLEAFKPLIDL
jgi:hypothetical protein